MVQNHDMKTWVKKALASNATATGSTNIGSGIIPTGMKRFVTYIRANRITVSAVQTACHIHIAEVSTSKPTSASAVAATNLKYLIGFQSGANTASSMAPVNVIEIGEPGSTKPILSIAGGTFAGVSASGGSPVDVVAQYYDE
jgi:hypothetical protein